MSQEQLRKTTSKNILGSSNTLAKSATKLQSVSRSALDEASQPQIQGNTSKPQSANSQHSAKQAKEASVTTLNTVAPTGQCTSTYYTLESIPGISPLFLTSQTQALFKVVVDQDVNAQQMYRMIPKSDLVSDMQTRLAISDFTPFKKEILAYPKEELLLHYDPDFKFGQNFFICLTTAAVDEITRVLDKADGQSDEPVVKKPLKIEFARPWNCLGSDNEIYVEKAKLPNELITLKVSRKKSEFKSPYKFGDRDAVDGFMELRPYRDSNNELTRMEIDSAIQAVPEWSERAAQTEWFRPVNFQCQYEPITMPPSEQEEILESQEMEDFIRNISARCEKALQQNELIDIFRDDYATLGEDEALLDHGQRTVLQEYQSFTDLKNSKGKSISSICWHPTFRGIIGISCAQKSGFEDRINNGSNVRPKGSALLIWSFHDPIHPQLLLDAPDDIYCFQFNPQEPNIVVGGCYNGQVVLWDISQYMELLKTQRNTEEGKEKQSHTPIAKWEVVSSIESSHRSIIQDIQWLPQNFELGHNGEPIENGENGHKQFVTCSLDGTVAFWDTRFKKDIKQLDLNWRPFIRISMSAQDNSFDYSLTKVSLNTDIKYISKKSANEGTEEKSDKKALQKVWTSKLYCATEEGDLLYGDWISEKTSEEKVSRVEQSMAGHYGPISDLDRSPFFPDLVLSSGGWTFHIWKEKNSMGPLLSGGTSTAYVTCGRWSPTRPGVFCIGRSDGVIEVWDLLDKSHLPSTVQAISSKPISYIQIQQHAGNRGSHAQFIAVGDDDGTLHILEIPKNLQKQSKNEVDPITRNQR